MLPREVRVHVDRRGGLELEHVAPGKDGVATALAQWRDAQRQTRVAPGHASRLFRESKDSYVLEPLDTAQNAAAGLDSPSRASRDLSSVRGDRSGVYVWPASTFEHKAASVASSSVTSEVASELLEIEELLRGNNDGGLDFQRPPPPPPDTMDDRRKAQQAAIEKVREQARLTRRLLLQQELAVLHDEKRLLRTSFDRLRMAARTHRALVHAYLGSLGAAFRQWALHARLRRGDARGKALRERQTQARTFQAWRQDTVRTLRLKVLTASVSARTRRELVTLSFEAIRSIAAVQKQKENALARAVLFWGHLRLRKGMRKLGENRHVKRVLRYRLDRASLWASGRLLRATFRRWRRGVVRAADERRSLARGHRLYRARACGHSLQTLKTFASASQEKRMILAKAMAFWERQTLRQHWVKWIEGAQLLRVSRMLSSRLRRGRLERGLAALRTHVTRQQLRREQRVRAFRSRWTLGLALRAWARLAGEKNGARVVAYGQLLARRNARILRASFVTWTSATVESMRWRRIQVSLDAQRLARGWTRLERCCRREKEGRLVRERAARYARRKGLRSGLQGLMTHTLSARQSAMDQGMVDGQTMKRCWRQWLRFVLESMKERQQEAAAQMWWRIVRLRMGLAGLKGRVALQRRDAICIRRGRRCLLQRMLGAWRMAVHVGFAEAFAARAWARQGERRALRRLASHVPQRRLRRGLDHAADAQFRKSSCKRCLRRLQEVVRARQVQVTQDARLQLVRAQQSLRRFRRHALVRRRVRENYARCKVADARRLMQKGLQGLARYSGSRIRARAQIHGAEAFARARRQREAVGALHFRALWQGRTSQRVFAMIKLRNERILRECVAGWRQEAAILRRLRGVGTVAQLYAQRRVKGRAISMLRLNATRQAACRRGDEHFGLKHKRAHWAAWREYHRTGRHVESRFAKERLRVYLWRWRRFMYVRRAKRKAIFFLAARLETSLLGSAFSAWKQEVAQRALKDAVEDVSEARLIWRAFRQWEEATSLQKLRRTQTVLAVVHWRSSMLRSHLRAWRMFREEESYVRAVVSCMSFGRMARAFGAWQKVCAQDPEGEEYDLHVRVR